MIQNNKNKIITKNDIIFKSKKASERAQTESVLKKNMLSDRLLGRNHIHLTVRLGFVTQHHWLGDFGKCNRGLRARALRLRYPKSSVTLPKVFGYVSLQLIS